MQLKNNAQSTKLKEEILTVIAQRLGIPTSGISIEDDFYDDLNASKLEKADIIQTLEEKYQFKFDEQDLKNLNTVAEIIIVVGDNVE